MAIDQTPSTSSTESMKPSAIDNEFPTYRAISSMAIFSLILGLASVFAFASLWFLLLSGASLLTGLLAIRKIHRYPEVLTGASFARVGIGVGLLFGLSAITHVVVEEFTTQLDINRFANHLVDVIKKEPVSHTLWYEQDPDFRAHNTPDQTVEAMKKAKTPSNPDPYGSKAAGVIQVKERLKTTGQEIKYTKIEKKYIDGLTIYANALVEVDGPATKEYPKKAYGVIQMTKGPGAGAYDWVVQDFKYPYTPESAALEIQAKDDGHGHSH